MNQQQIKDGITQGTWVLKGNQLKIDDNNPANHIGLLYVSHETVHNKIKKTSKDVANGTAICHAINNTYVIGIDPEKIPELINALERIRKHFSNYPSLCAGIDKLLKSARLKNT